MSTTKKKTVIEHIDELIEFYSEVQTSDERLRKLIVRNLKDVRKRAEDTFWKGYIQRQNEAIEICKICKYKNKLEQLETKEQKLIEKLEKRRKQNNDRYGKSIDDDEFPKMYEYGAKVSEDDYILNILKGEKE